VNSNALTAVTSSDQAARIIYGDTFANGVAYTTPTMNGFSATVGTAFAQTVTTGVGNDTANKDTFSYTAQYSQGPINAAYNLTDAKASGGGASNGAYKIHTALVSYNFGVARVGLTHQSIKLEIGTSPGDAMALTANIPMGAGSIGVQYGKRSDKAVADTRFNDNAKQLAVGYRYDLSKRTAVSLVYNKLDRATAANDIKETHVMIGHTF
jgi:predicted porin